MCGRGFALEIVQPLFYHREKRLAIHLQMVRGDHSLVYFAQQKFLADTLGERRAVFLQKAAFPRKDFDDPLALQLGIGLGDRIAIEAQFLGQRPDGRQGLTRSQGARRRRVADLIHQLSINRFAGFEIDLEQHSS